MANYNQTNPINYIKALHRETDGFITLFRKLENNKVKQRHYKLKQLNEDVLRNFVDSDCYISLNSFYLPQRGNTCLRTIHNLYIDLDTYNTPYTNEQVIMQLEKDYFGQSIPTPNIILRSGRGIGLIWNIEPISGLSIKKFNTLQQALYETLKEFGADNKALDAARIFRLPSSINSKSNEIVSYDQLHDYEFSIEEIASDYLGIELIQREVIKSQNKPDMPIKPIKSKAHSKPSKARKKRKGISYFFTAYSLHKARLADLERLLRLRDGKCEGHRERLLFLVRYYALRVNGGNDNAAIQKIEMLNGLFDVPLSQSELVTATQSAVTYYKEGTGISISNATLIDWFNITADEQQQLSTIISKTEKRERDRVRKERNRRAAGTQSMQQYNAKRLQAVIRTVKRLKLIISTYPRHSIRELAERAGLSKSYVADLKKRMDELLALDAQMHCENSVCEYGGKVSTDVSAYVRERAVVPLPYLLEDDFIIKLRRLDYLMKQLRAT